jgi:hypothetical protein
MITFKQLDELWFKFKVPLLIVGSLIIFGNIIIGFVFAYLDPENISSYIRISDFIFLIVWIIVLVYCTNYKRK